ncbi:ATP-binding protein [Flavobacterium tructae]|uniref:histidine kinase n=1 Tax=Flavobacterium tructae TaxID=1114873 RepID=A0A1S1J332_9FLAO|nr:ATP-binding protein [Flavobacterium tructae]OHT45052.1 histidine kinase [Flavobacterium tructae]OXB16596.1 ATP-binding protein [Flavobacterium tructae]
MLRSPFFCFIIFLFLFSCKEEKTNITSKASIQKEAFRLRDKAIENFKEQNFNTSFYEFNKSKQLYEILKDSANIGYVLTMIGCIQQVNGDYYGSKETVTEAIVYVKKKSMYAADINNALGIADKELSQYNDAIFYYKEAVKDYPTALQKLLPLSNIAPVYIHQKKYPQAIAILEFILSTKLLDDKSQEINKARIQDNLGYSYFKNGIDEKGFHLMNEALQTRNEIKDTYGSIESYLHLADYHAKKDIQRSDENALAAYNIATKLNSIDERLEALQILISNDHSPQNHKYVQKYFKLNDSIIKVRNNFKNKFAKIKYDAKVEKDENAKLRLEKAETQLSLQKAKYLRIVYIIIFVFLVILILIVVRYYKNKNKAIEFKTSYMTEARIAKKIHDELANDVYNVIAFAESQPLSKENTRENLLQKLDDIYGRVRGISRENNKIETGADFTYSIKEMLSTYKTNERNIIVTNLESINWETINDTKKITISRILQELMVNMRKHSNASIVGIKFENNEKSIAINYTDNGKGFEKATIAKNGLQNMEQRIQAVKGTITFDTAPDKGFKANLSIPK